MAKSAKPKFTYDFPRPALTVDVVLLTREAVPKLLLIQRKRDPFAGAWALPGGFVEEGETLAAAARRELLEETGVEVGRSPAPDGNGTVVDVDVEHRTPVAVESGDVEVEHLERVFCSEAVGPAESAAPQRPAGVNGKRTTTMFKKTIIAVAAAGLVCAAHCQP